MARVLMQVVHYPHPEYVDALFAAMSQVSDASVGLAGLECIGAFHDAEHGRVFAVSVWESRDALDAGFPTLFASIGDLPFDVWKRREMEVYTSTRRWPHAGAPPPEPEPGDDTCSTCCWSTTATTVRVHISARLADLKWQQPATDRHPMG